MAIHSKFAGRLLMQCKANFTHYLSNEKTSSLLVAVRFVRTLGIQFMASLDRHTISTRLQLLSVGSTECMETPKSLSYDLIQFRPKKIL